MGKALALVFNDLIAWGCFNSVRWQPRPLAKILRRRSLRALWSTVPTCFPRRPRVSSSTCTQFRWDASSVRNLTTRGNSRNRSEPVPSTSESHSSHTFDPVRLDSTKANFRGGKLLVLIWPEHISGAGHRPGRSDTSPSVRPPALLTICPSPTRPGE